MRNHALEFCYIPGVFWLIPSAAALHKEREGIQRSKAIGREVWNMIVGVHSMLHGYLMHVTEQKQQSQQSEHMTHNRQRKFDFSIKANDGAKAKHKHCDFSIKAKKSFS